MFAGTLRSTPALWLGTVAVCLTLAGFAAGFAASRYAIDRELADGAAVLERSTHTYEAEQTLLFAEWAGSYVRLHRHMAALSQRNEVVRHGH